ncbi:MAG: hypothetical protein JO222_03290 [Frankiales bacterium]|nr:hypothetical protein [Frankiales bacterium]
MAAELVASRGTTWGGLAVGLIALGLFVAFSGWVVVQRVRHGRKDSDG